MDCATLLVSMSLHVSVASQHAAKLSEAGRIGLLLGLASRAKKLLVVLLMLTFCTLSLCGRVACCECSLCTHVSLSFCTDVLPLARFLSPAMFSSRSMRTCCVLLFALCCYAVTVPFLRETCLKTRHHNCVHGNVLSSCSSVLHLF